MAIIGSTTVYIQKKVAIIGSLGKQELFHCSVAKCYIKYSQVVRYDFPGVIQCAIMPVLSVFSVRLILAIKVTPLCN